MMNLDEAIQHCKEKAKELREQPFKEKMDIEDVASCEECAEEHEQLAEWLMELKKLREEKKGEWIEMADNYGHSSYFCTRCGTQKGKPYDVCPNCKADMRGKEE